MRPARCNLRAAACAVYTSTIKSILCYEIVNFTLLTTLLHLLINIIFLIRTKSKLENGKTLTNPSMYTNDYM